MMKQAVQIVCACMQGCGEDEMIEILYALWLRQVRRQVRSRARMISSLGQPLLFLLAVGFGFSTIFEKAGQGNYLQFLTPGIIAMGILFTSMISGIEIIWDRQFGFLKEMMVAPVSRSVIMLGRTLGGATVAIIQGVFVFLISLAFGFRPDTLFGLLPAFGFMFLIAFLFTAIGTAIASVMNDMQSFPLVMNFVIMPLFFLSGALFPLDSVPKVLLNVAIINPLSYGVDGLRFSLIHASHFNVGVDAIVLFIFAILSLFVGSHLFSKIQL